MYWSSASRKGTMKQILKVAYQYLAICICIQTLQNHSKKTQKAIDPQRANIKEAIEHFSWKWKRKVYIKNKPIKWRLKYYLIVDSLYYYSWFKLYKEADKKDPTVKQKTRHLCNEALDTLPNEMECYVVYVDNYYGSLELAENTTNRRFDFTFNCR